MKSNLNKKRKCRHKETYVKRFKLPKGTEFEPEIYTEIIYRKCFICGKTIETKYY